MADLKLVKRIFGFILIFLGLIFMIVDRYSCRWVGNINNSEEFILCIKLFIFVGIIFVVCGASLLIMANTPPEVY